LQRPDRAGLLGIGIGIGVGVGVGQIARSLLLFDEHTATGQQLHQPGDDLVQQRLQVLISGGISLAPVGASAALQAQAPRVAGKVGNLHPRTIAPTHATLTILRPAWQKLGNAEGESVPLRSADEDPRRLPALVNELIDQGTGVLIAVGASAVRAASQTTKSVPIVAIDLETDPATAGYAATFARPGGNVTGLFLNQPALAGKSNDLLREASDLERIALLWDRSTGVDQPGKH